MTTTKVNDYEKNIIFIRLEFNFNKIVNEIRL